MAIHQIVVETFHWETKVRDPVIYWQWDIPCGDSGVAEKAHGQLVHGQLLRIFFLNRLGCVCFSQLEIEKKFTAALLISLSL